MQITFAVIKNLGKKILDDDCMGLASELAFNFLLSLFPFAILIFALLSVFGSENIIYQILSIIKLIAPIEALNLIEEVLKSLFKASSGEILTISIIGTLWTASNVIVSLMKGLNRVYGINETRPVWKTRFISVLILFITGIIIVLGSNLIIFAGIILKLFKNFNIITSEVSSLILIIRWPVSFFSLFLLLLVVYYFVPNISGSNSERFCSSISGALFFCIFWLFASWAFSLYVENFGRYNAVYGSLGAVVILLLWLYYTSLILLIGGEINAQIYKLKC